MYQSIFRPDLFQDKVVLITGGGTGIGRAIAHEIASLGGHVILAARKEERLTATAEEINAAGGKASFATVNIRDEAVVQELIESVLADHGRIDALVNNAGGQFFSPAENISQKGWHAVVETNLTGTFNMCNAAFRQHMKENGGAIVNIVAEMWRGFPGMVHTGAARAGVVNLTKTLAIEWAPQGVRVNSVAPGMIDGHGLTQYPAEVTAMVRGTAKADTPSKRLGTESEISAAVTFLLSPAAAYITGETLKVDGGSSLWRMLWDVPEHDNLPPFNGFPE